MQFKLPYFDMILSRLACGDPEFEEVFSRHVHFGVWQDPDKATGEPADNSAAMDRLCQHLIDLADIRPGQDVLDAGCGFGGTLAALDEQLSPLSMTGLNIDGRQLELARGRVTAGPGNRIDFVLGDACAMPFSEASFDRVLAVECIFHFPSREAFFEQVGRVLRPGGNLTLSDFLQPEGMPPGTWDDRDHSIWGSYTAIDLPAYQELGSRVGLELTHAQDISLSVRPTYQWFGRMLGKHFPEAEQAVLDSRLVVDIGGTGYCTLRFDRVA